MGDCTMDCVVSKVSLKMLKLALATVKEINVDSKGKRKKRMAMWLIIY